MELARCERGKQRWRRDLERLERRLAAQQAEEESRANALLYAASQEGRSGRSSRGAHGTPQQPHGEA